VLHFVGAKDGFIARQFQRHFWCSDLKVARRRGR
jgi:cell division protein FtsX